MICVSYFLRRIPAVPALWWKWTFPAAAFSTILPIGREKLHGPEKGVRVPFPEYKIILSLGVNSKSSPKSPLLPCF
jgi:hypothetical protein